MNDRVFVLRPYVKAETLLRAIIITPEITDASKVTSAWSYAVRYTAKGLDLPDYEAAIKLLKQRHPSWTVLESSAITVNVDLTAADKDIPENES